MKELTKVEGFKKGDKIKMVEVAPICNNVHYENGKMIIEDKEPEYHEFISVREITRVNSKTYTFKYIEGPYKGSGGKWIKNFDLTTLKDKKFYLMEG